MRKSASLTEGQTQNRGWERYTGLETSQNPISDSGDSLRKKHPALWNPRGVKSLS